MKRYDIIKTRLGPDVMELEDGRYCIHSDCEAALIEKDEVYANHIREIQHLNESLQAKIIENDSLLKLIGDIQARCTDDEMLEFIQAAFAKPIPSS